MRGARIRCDDVHVRLGGVNALRGVSLDVPAGTTTAVLGPSGAGKTTLLRAIAGLLAPDRGRVLLDDRDVTATPPERRGVGLVFQDQLLFPHRDVLGNVAFGPRMAGLDRSRREAVARDWLARVDLAGYDHRDLTTLSGGQRQRVALARALAADPHVLLLDEPLGALDVELRDRLSADLRGIVRDTGITVVVVTHDPVEAMTLADRLVVLVEGGVAQAGETDEVWARPSTVDVARLLGHRGLVRARVGDGRVISPVGTWDVGQVGGSMTVHAGPAWLVVPPDALRLAPPTAAATGRVIDVVRVGPASRVRVALHDAAVGAPPGTPAEPLEILVDRLADPGPGAVVGLAVDPDRCALVPDTIGQ